VEFRAEAFNLPNHLNPNQLVAAINKSELRQDPCGAWIPRIIQLALKVVF
jgi:hypothetical protein